MGLLACGAKSQEDRVAKFEAMLGEELGTAVELECPPMVDQTAHYCTAVLVDDEELVFPVRVISNGNDLEYTTKDWVPGARMEALGRHALEEKFNLAVDAIKCPTISHMPDGATVQCEAVAEGVTMSLDASMVVKVRKLSFKPVSGVVYGDAVARAAHEALHEKGVHAEVTCAQRVVVSVPGKRFECDAGVPGGEPKTVHVLINDAAGSFVVDDEPPKAGATQPEPPIDDEPPKEEVPT